MSIISGHEEPFFCIVTISEKKCKYMHTHAHTYITITWKSKCKSFQWKVLNVLVMTDIYSLVFIYIFVSDRVS